MLFTVLRQVALGLCLGSASVGGWAQSAALPPAYTLRIVGGLGSLNQYTRNELPFWTQELSRLSAGKFNAEIVPFDQAGVPSGDMLRLMQLGVVPFGTVPLSAIAAKYPQYSAPDLAGLNTNMASLKRNLALFKPYLENELRTRHNIELLALYVYPAQVLFCHQAIKGLGDLAGRRVRVSSATQSDFVSALGASPVLTSFSQVMERMTSRNIDCAITGTMSGNTIGLHEITSHVHSLPINWGVAIFGANRNAWEALPPDLRALLSKALPRLESAIWTESERETADGLACNTGAGACRGGRRGQMIEVAASADDQRLAAQVFNHEVLAKWLQRCPATCALVWNQTIGPAQGVLAPTSP